MFKNRIFFWPFLLLGLVLGLMFAKLKREAHSYKPQTPTEELRDASFSEDQTPHQTSVGFF